MSIEKIKNYFEPKSILDIGANVGQFYNESKNIFPDAYYYLIEGNENCEIVLSSLNVDYSISLLSDREKEVDFYIRKYEPRCTGNSIYRENTSFYDDDQILVEKKQTQTLSNLLPNKKFDLIKIDVQGSEIDIINGGIELFKNAKAVLMEVSLVEFNKNAPTKDFVYKFMENIGFEPVEILNNLNHPETHELIQQDVFFLKKKKNKIALTTVLFDYPEHYKPTFYKKGIQIFEEEDIHIIRHSNLIKTESYCDKLYFYKVVKLIEYVENNLLGKYEYILFMDATDTAFIKSFDGVLEKFKKLNCNILFGAEKELWPPTKYVHLYNNKKNTTEFCYLNSGTYFGYTESVYKYLKDMIDNDYYKDDQGAWTAVYLLNDDIKIDQNCDIFFSTHKSKNKINKKDDNIELINVDAHIVHDNGGYHEETLKLVEYYI